MSSLEGHSYYHIPDTGRNDQVHSCAELRRRMFRQTLHIRSSPSMIYEHIVSRDKEGHVSTDIECRQQWHVLLAGILVLPAVAEAARR